MGGVVVLLGLLGNVLWLMLAVSTASAAIDKLGRLKIFGFYPVDFL
jgi:hypothetical protein